MLNMPIEEPQGFTFQTSYSDGKYIFTLPKRNTWAFFLFLTVWLAGWAFGEFTVALTVASGLFHMKFPQFLGQIGKPSGPDSGFMIVWLIGWTAAGVYMIYTWLWVAWGRETVAVGSDLLAISRIIPGYARTKDYRLPDVHSLRVAPNVYNRMDPMSSMRMFTGGSGSCIAFDYGAKTIRFGSSEEAELKAILAEILKQFPALGS